MAIDNFCKMLKHSIVSTGLNISVETMKPDICSEEFDLFMEWMVGHWFSIIEKSLKSRHFKHKENSWIYLIDRAEYQIFPHVWNDTEPVPMVARVKNTDDIDVEFVDHVYPDWKRWYDAKLAGVDLPPPMCIKPLKPITIYM